MPRQPKSFVIKGNFCYSESPTRLICQPDSYAVCIEGHSAGVFSALPERYQALPLLDWGDAIVIPGLTDLHTHAPQFGNRGMALDLELLDWLDTYTFPEEAKFAQTDYARRAYRMFAQDLYQGATTRACIFGTIHLPATLILMEELERTGLVSYVGKVNMDRNSPPELTEQTDASIHNTKEWVQQARRRFRYTKPILTPRFIPSCSDRLLEQLGRLAGEERVPVQSHLSENRSELELVKSLCPWAESYGHAYSAWGLFGNRTPTIMAHCVWSSEAEVQLMKAQGIMIAHSPSSNTQLASGIAPVRRYLEEGLRVGLATDVAAGLSLSMLRAISDAIAVSKLYWCYVDRDCPPLKVEEAFYLATIGGGRFFGQVGSFLPGYEFDAVALWDDDLLHPQPLTLRQRLERVIHLSEGTRVTGKIVQGRMLFAQTEA